MFGEAPTLWGLHVFNVASQGIAALLHFALLIRVQPRAPGREAASLLPREMPLVLQPVSGQRFGPPTGEHMLALQRAAMTVHPKTRVIPQTHRSLHVR